MLSSHYAPRAPSVTLQPIFKCQALSPTSSQWDYTHSLGSGYHVQADGDFESPCPVPAPRLSSSPACLAVHRAGPRGTSPRIHSSPRHPHSKPSLGSALSPTQLPKTEHWASLTPPALPRDLLILPPSSSQFLLSCHCPQSAAITPGLCHSSGPQIRSPAYPPHCNHMNCILSRDQSRKTFQRSCPPDLYPLPSLHPSPLPLLLPCRIISRSRSESSQPELRVGLCPSSPSTSTLFPCTCTR